MRRAGKFIFGIVASATAVMPVASQTPPAQKPAFEVALVKPTSVIGPINGSGGRFIAAGQSLKGLIVFAYRLRPFQMIGGPAWIDNDRWQIEAKAEEGIVPARPASRTIADAMKIDTIALMLQSLLEDRFALRLHREMRDLPIYELIVAKGGPKIRLADDQTPSTPPAAPPPRLPNGLPVLTRSSARIGRGPSGMHIEAKAIALDMFVNMLIGLIYCAVPITCPVRVTGAASATFMVFAKPKSRIFTRSSDSTKIFAGLISR